MNNVPEEESRLGPPWCAAAYWPQNREGLRITKTWCATFGHFDIILVKLPSGMWEASSYPVLSPTVLASPDVREAACQAKALLAVHLQNTVDKLTGISEPQDFQ